VRRAKVALIERASAFEGLDPPRLTVTQMIRLLNALDRGRLIVPKPIDASATMPSQEPDRSAEAIRRVLPELRKLDRYELPRTSALAHSKPTAASWRSRLRVAIATGSTCAMSPSRHVSCAAASPRIPTTWASPSPAHSAQGQR
jgi:hypothetical protein